MMHMDILFKDITAVTMQPDRPVLHNVNVGVWGKKIAYIGKEERKATRVIDGTHKVLMPGLYNGHTHAAMTLLRGFANDRSLEDWLFNHIFPAEQKLTPDIVRTGVTLAIAEMVASGTVSFTDMYFFVDIAAEAVYEAGVKANLCNAVIAFDRDGYDFHADRVYAQTLNILRDFHNQGDGRIKAEASIHGVYTSFAPAWEQVVGFAREYGLGMHVHISETKTEHENCLGAYGMTPTQVFARYGVLDVPASAAHCVWVSEADMDILAEKGVSVAHNPYSNLKLASGVAPVQRMLEKGINVTLGTDGMASNNSHDLFEEIKLSSCLQKYAANDPSAAPAYVALKTATVNGAKAQGRENESGMVKEGFDADLVLMDFNTPRNSICYDPALNLAYSATGRDVAMTMCQGKILYENGEYKTIDIEKVLFEARKAQGLFAATS
jgi:5-methylthioadenosine/S-adenosylhomocysteine deaminase